MRALVADMGIDQLLQHIEEIASRAKRTLLITDHRCIEHADFPQKRNVKEKAL